MRSLPLFAVLAYALVCTRASSRTARQVRQSSGGSAHDGLCNEVMCIEADVEGDTARYVLRSTNAVQLGWMAVGFGRFMGDSPMVIMWPSRDPADGSYASVTLSQRKAPFEVMPTPDPDPPFRATLDLSSTSVTGEHPQMAFTRPAPADGMQNIIWAFSHTPPGSSDENTRISVHQRYGRATLNLTRVEASHADQDHDQDQDASAGAGHGQDLDSISDPAEASAPSDAAASESTAPAALVGGSESEAETAVAEPSGGGGWGFASFVHATLCSAAFLLVIPSGALVVRYAKITGSSAAFDLHRQLQFGVAGTSIAVGMLAYLFMDGDGLGTAHKLWGAVLVLLYGVQCAVGFWVQRIPDQSRTRVHSLLLAGLGGSIVLLAFYDAWLGLDAGGDGPLLWYMILFLGIPSLYVVGVVIIQRRFGRLVLESTKGEYVALDPRSGSANG